MKLSKTDNLIYRECAHNAWVKIHASDIYRVQPLSAFDEAIIETGNEVDDAPAICLRATRRSRVAIPKALVDTSRYEQWCCINRVRDRSLYDCVRHPGVECSSWCVRSLRSGVVAEVRKRGAKEHLQPRRQYSAVVLAITVHYGAARGSSAKSVNVCNAKRHPA